MRIVTCAARLCWKNTAYPQRPRELAALPLIGIESPDALPRLALSRQKEAEDRLVLVQPVLSLTTPEAPPGLPARSAY